MPARRDPGGRLFSSRAGAYSPVIPSDVSNPAQGSQLIIDAGELCVIKTRTRKVEVKKRVYVESPGVLASLEDPSQGHS